MACRNTALKTWNRLTSIANLLCEDDDHFNIAEMNLWCAAGLPGAEHLDIVSALRRLSQWTTVVDHGTARMLPKFRNNPEEFGNCEATFRMLVLTTVLQRNLRIRYDPSQMGDPTSKEFLTRPIKDSRPKFLHGLLFDRLGTCSSMPVLVVAIGRTLGYPLHLCRAKGHFFARWEESQKGVSFNIEATSPGLNVRSDEHYRQWPFPLTDGEIKTGEFLRSLNTREQFAAFLGMRAFCLLDNGRNAEAAQGFSLAAQVDPVFQGYTYCRDVATMRRLRQPATTSSPAG